MLNSNANGTDSETPLVRHAGVAIMQCAVPRDAPRRRARRQSVLGCLWQLARLRPAGCGHAAVARALRRRSTGRWTRWLRALRGGPSIASSCAQMRICDGAGRQSRHRQSRFMRMTRPVGVSLPAVHHRVSLPSRVSPSPKRLAQLTLTFTCSPLPGTCWHQGWPP